MPDIGLTHVALAATDLKKSIDFYRKYAKMKIVHQRTDVAWLSDETRPFIIVLVNVEKPESPLGPFSHLGVACATREELDYLVNLARKENCLAREPTDSGPPVGYWAFIKDPDGNMLELSFGQEVTKTVNNSQ